MSRKIIPLLVILALLTLSCSRSLAGKTGSTPVVVPIGTDFLKATVEAMRPPTITPTPTHDITLGTVTPIPPTNTPIPTSTPVQDPNCYLGLEASDITVEDGSEIKAGEHFTKTWKLLNTGSCYWTGDFQLVFISGEPMSANSPQRLGSTVYSKKEIEMSVDMVAPNTPGNYIGYWQLQMPDGYPVGWLWVEILVVP